MLCCLGRSNFICVFLVFFDRGYDIACSKKSKWLLFHVMIVSGFLLLFSTEILFLAKTLLANSSNLNSSLFSLDG